MMVEVKNQQRLVQVNLRRLRKDAEYLLKLLNLDGVELSIVLANDNRIKRLNQVYRGKDSTTDVLSFPMSDPSAVPYPVEDILLGDIVINAHMSRRRSKEARSPLHAVIRQLIIHGLLHLVGYDHEKSTYHARKMSVKEKELLDALSKLDQ